MSYRDLLFNQFGGTIIYIPCEDTANTWETRGSYVWNPTRLGTPQLTEGIFGGQGFKHASAVLIRALNDSTTTGGDRKQSSGWFRLSDEYDDTGVAMLWSGANDSTSSYDFSIMASGIRWRTRYYYTTEIFHERSLNDGQWHHWAVNGSGFWLDGELIFAHTSLTYNAGNYRTERSFSIGSASSSTNPMREFLTYDEVAVYPGGGLTDAMIIEQANAQQIPWSVLESGLEVPVEVEGESLYVQGNPSPVTTMADLYFNENEVSKPITATLSRTNTLPTTYSVWAKWGSAPTGATGIFSHQPGTTFETNNNNLYVQTTGVLHFNTYTGETTVNISDHFTDGQWHHYAATITGNTHLLYVDGVLRETKTLSKSSVALDTLRFGLMVSGATQHGPLPGTLDDCAVVSSVLSDQDIADIYNAGRHTFAVFRLNPLVAEGTYNATTQTVEPF